MKLLELFCGTKSVANVFLGAGHQAITVDIDFGFQPDICIDIRAFHSGLLPNRFLPDVIWASPPCEGFSVATIGRNWNKDYTPKGAAAKLGLILVESTLRIIREIEPEYYFIENPMGMLRKMPIMANLTRRTVTYCQYGDNRRKATDIWTNCNQWVPRPMCRNGDTCHESAPRGAKSGTQGLGNRTERAKIPKELALEILEAVSTKGGNC